MIHPRNKEQLVQLTQEKILECKSLIDQLQVHPQFKQIPSLDRLVQCLKGYGDNPLDIYLRLSTWSDKDLQDVYKETCLMVEQIQKVLWENY